MLLQSLLQRYLGQLNPLSLSAVKSANLILSLPF